MDCAEPEVSEVLMIEVPIPTGVVWIAIVVVAYLATQALASIRRPK
jgi:hypothetical protein